MERYESCLPAPTKRACFAVVQSTFASLAPNARSYPWAGSGDDYANYLIDTTTGAIVFCDQMEPEDASLTRGLSPLVDLLNEVSA